MDYNTFKKLEFRRKFFKLVGAEISIVNPASDAEVGFITMKAWKLREDIRLYSNRDKKEELFRLHARSIIDFGTTYDVFDSATDKLRFSLRRKGLRSTFVRDHWLVLNDDTTIGEVIETSSWLALLRRWIGIIPIVGEIIDILLSFAPQTYRFTNAGGELLAELTHRKNPFIVRLDYDTTNAKAKPIDYYMGAAIGSLLSIVDADK